jgi:hypothetical protein
MSAGNPGRSAWYASLMMPHWAGTSCLAVSYGIGTTSNVVFKVPVASSGYCCAIGLGLLPVEQLSSAVAPKRRDNSRAAIVAMLGKDILGRKVSLDRSAIHAYIVSAQKGRGNKYKGRRGYLNCLPLIQISISEADDWAPDLTVPERFHGSQTSRPT